MRRQYAFFAHDIENEIRVNSVTRIAEPPARVAEPNALHAVLDLEPPGILDTARHLSFRAVLVRIRALHDFEFWMRCEDLVMHAADPVPSRSNLAVRHCKQILSERRAKGLKHLLRRI